MTTQRPLTKRGQRMRRGWESWCGVSRTPDAMISSDAVRASTAEAVAEAARYAAKILLDGVSISPARPACSRCCARCGRNAGP